MGDNDPYYFHINLVLPKLLHSPVHLTGNTPGYNVLTLGDPTKQSKFGGGHLITRYNEAFVGLVARYNY